MLLIVGLHIGHAINILQDRPYPGGCPRSDASRDLEPDDLVGRKKRRAEGKRQKETCQKQDHNLLFSIHGAPLCRGVGRNAAADDADDTVAGLGVRAGHLRAIDHNRATHNPCRRATRTLTYFISKAPHQKQGLKAFFFVNQKS